MSFYDNMAQTSYFHGERITALGLVLNAYGVKIANYIKNLPDWANSTRYDVTAKSDDAADNVLAKMRESDAYAEKRLMLRGLLADRFKLQIHAETKIADIEELVATDRTAKLMTSVTQDLGKTIGSCNAHYSRQGAEVAAKGCPPSVLLMYLRGEFGTEIVDQTGLSGNYAYDLRFNPATEPLKDGEERYPALKDALREQLGLTLRAVKGPVTLWVVDHIEKPTPN